MIYHPLSLLHVIVTDMVYMRWRELLKTWRKKQLMEESKRYYLRLKMIDTKNTIKVLEDLAHNFQYPDNKKVILLDNVITDISELYNELIIIYKKDIYYRSIEWEDKH